MIESGVNAATMKAQASNQELVRFKVQMDNLKNNLTPGPGKEKKLKEACQDFEAVFISKLWQEMQSTIPKEGYLHSKQEEMYLSMFDRAFAEKIAEGGGIGLSDMLYDQLKDKLKNTGAESMPGTVEIKPLTESGKNGIRSLQEAEDGFKSPEKALNGDASTNKAVSRPIVGNNDVMSRVNALARQIELDHAREQAGTMNVVMKDGGK